jgi:hypothetical protein
VATEITEALTALGANALVQKVISPDLLETVRRYSPLVGFIPTDPWTSNIYYFNSRNQLPQGGFVTDGGARPVSSSNYVQAQFTIRNMQTVGSVTGYAQEVTRSQIGNLLQKEIQGATKGLVWDIETGMDWGCAAATANTFPEYDGLDVQCSQFSTTSNPSNMPINSQDMGGAELTSGMLDQLVELVESNMAEPVIGDDWAFVLSSRAVSALGQQFLPQQRYNSVEIAPGVNVPAYREIPFLKSSFLNARSVAMPAVTATPANTVAGASLPAGEYFYRLSAVMGRYGELNACAEVNATVTGGSSTVTLAFAPPASIEGGLVQSYRVFRSTATGQESLIGICDAVVGFLADGITPIFATSIVDNGSSLCPVNGATVPAILPVAYYGTNAGVLPRVVASSSGGLNNGGGEDIYLISRNSDNVVRPYVRDIQPIPLAATVTQPDVLPFALVTDTCLAVRAVKYMGRLRNVVADLSNTSPVVLTYANSNP